MDNSADSGDTGSPEDIAATLDIQLMADGIVPVNGYRGCKIENHITTFRKPDKILNIQDISLDHFQG